MDRYRQELWNGLSIPYNFRQSVEKMSFVDRASFMFNAFYIVNVEWTNLYDNIAFYLCAMVQYYDTMTQ